MTDETTNAAADPHVTAEMTNEEKVKAFAGGEITIAREVGGVDFKKMSEIVDVARLMMRAGPGVPSHLRNQLGLCWVVCYQAYQWDLDPLFAANHSYVVNDRLSYDSQLIHAVVEARAPLKERLRVYHSGEGDERTCTVTGTFRGESKARELTTRPLKDLHPGYTVMRRAEDGGKGKRKVTYAQGQKMLADGMPDDQWLVPAGSPLWDKKPDQQLAYNAIFDWARLHASREIGGIYSPDEMADYADERGRYARDITAESEDLQRRLADATAPENGRGFRDDVVADGLSDEGDEVKVPGDEDELREQLKASAEKERKKAERRKSSANKARRDTRASIRERRREADYKKMRDKSDERIPKRRNRTAEAMRDATPPTPPKPPALPTNVKEYLAYAERWIKAETDPAELAARWARERRMRNQLGVTQEDRHDLEALKTTRITALQ